MKLHICHLWSRFSRRSWLGVLAFCMVGVFASVLLAETPLPPTKRAERLTFDSQSEQWISTPSPIPGTEDGDLDIARQWLARGEYKKACKAAKKWIKTYSPSAERYPEALYVKGTAYLERGRYYTARKIYQELLEDYPGSEYAELALSGVFRIGEQYLAGQKRRAWGGLIRMKDYDGGLDIMDEMIADYPDTPKAEKAHRTKADYYYARGEFELAEDEYAFFAREYPRSRWHPRALFRSAYSALASFPGVQFDDAALVESQERFTQFQKSFPDVAQQLEVPVIMEQIAAKRADKTYEIAWFYERTANSEPERRAASYYYRTILRVWPNTPAAAQAGGRLAAMGEPADSEQASETAQAQGG